MTFGAMNDSAAILHTVASWIDVDGLKCAAWWLWISCISRSLASASSPPPPLPPTPPPPPAGDIIVPLITLDRVPRAVSCFRRSTREVFIPFAEIVIPSAARLRFSAGVGNAAFPSNPARDGTLGGGRGRGGSRETRRGVVSESVLQEDACSGDEEGKESSP